MYLRLADKENPPDYREDSEKYELKLWNKHRVNYMNNSILRFDISHDYLCIIDIYFSIIDFDFQSFSLKSLDLLSISEITR
jgi:hypothetical protein